MEENIQTRLRDGGILIATIDMPGRSMNVFSEALMDAVEALLDRSDNDGDIRAVVVTSGKATFLAGADLQMISQFAERALEETPETLNPFYGRLSRLFNRLEKSVKPYVAALNGLALGGGLELAMACHERVLVDDPRAVVGLPEIKLGLLPGAGGTQRLPSLVGIETGLDMLLRGNPLPPTEALQRGLVDQLVEPDQLLDAAVARAKALADIAVSARPARPGESTPFDFSGGQAERQIADALTLSDEQLEHYPAYRAIIDCVAGGWTLDWDAAFEHEIDVFTHLMYDTPVAGNMVRTMFLNLQKAGKQLRRPAGESLAVNDALADKFRQKLEKAFDLSDDADCALVAQGSDASAATTIEFVTLTDGGCAAQASSNAVLYVAEKTPEGQCAEIQAQDDASREMALKIAAALRLTPLLSAGPPLLPALKATHDAVRDLPREQRMLACALTAERLHDAGTQMAPELADVASVLAGFMPAFSGGVFTYLRQTPGAKTDELAASAPANLAEYFKRSAADLA